MRALVLVSLALFVVRLWAAAHVGFGDSEALYATWALHPQPAYLDHPGLVGLVARTIGAGTVPTPLQAHVVTTTAATLFPWLFVAVARAAGATARHAAAAGVVLALVPEIGVGLFALTPDLLLAPLWLGALGLAIVGLAPPAGQGRSRGKNLGREAALLGAGLLAGVAASAKVSGVLLMAALAVAYVAVGRGGGARANDDLSAASAARSLWPWAGLAAGVVVLIPVALYEAHLGFPMLRHRFVDTQRGAGIGLQNIAVMLGGQLAYLSPVVAWIAMLVARDLWRRRRDDVIAQLLWASFAIPLVPLVALCIWSPVAEPHWLAPPLLALPLHAARRASGAPAVVSRTLARAGAGVAGAFTLAAHLWVLVPASSALLPSDVDRRADIASELYGWPTAIAAVRAEMRAAATPFDPEGAEIVVVGPHWTVCAQLAAGLAETGVHVGCATPIPDDFDRWSPREAWRRAEQVLFVTDNRFPDDGADQLPAHVRVAQKRVRIFRGGRTSRIFDLTLYSRREGASRDRDNMPLFAQLRRP